MKKNYEKPYVEKVEFDYSNQVVVASGCVHWRNEGDNNCTSNSYSTCYGSASN